MEEELFAALESNEKPFQEESKFQPKKDFKQSKENLWEKNDFEPLKIDVANFKKVGKSFAVITYKDSHELIEEINASLLRIARALISKGYKFRHNASSTDGLQNNILATEGIEVESFLPWAKFNANIIKPILKYGNETGYRIACNYHKTFNNLPPAVRALLASKVNSLLHKDCNNPVDLVVCYNPNGDEGITRDTDFKELGNLGFPIRICSNSNIPVFNIGKDDAVDRISEFIKSKEVPL